MAGSFGVGHLDAYRPSTIPCERPECDSASHGWNRGCQAGRSSASPLGSPPSAGGRAASIWGGTPSSGSCAPSSRCRATPERGGHPSARGGVSSSACRFAASRNCATRSAHPVSVPAAVGASAPDGPGVSAFERAQHHSAADPDPFSSPCSAAPDNSNPIKGFRSKFFSIGVASGSSV